MNLYIELERKSRIKRNTVIYPESYDDRVINAVGEVLKKKLAKVILIETGKSLARITGQKKNLTIINIDLRTKFVEEYYKLRRKRNPSYDFSQAEKDLMDPLTFSCMLLKKNFAEGVIAGSVYPTSAVLRNAITITGLAKNNKTVSSFFLFTFPAKSVHKKKILAYADCGVIPAPTVEQLSDIAIQTSSNFQKLTGIKPRVAFLSFSTKGSSDDLSIDKIIQAYNLTKRRKPGLICDAELQFDAAFVPSVARRKNPSGMIRGNANVFIFPDLNSANIAYKITERLGGAFATGPIVQGLSKPVMDLSRGCSESDIVNMTSVITNII